MRAAALLLACMAAAAAAGALAIGQAEPRLHMAPINLGAPAAAANGNDKGPERYAGTPQLAPPLLPTADRVDAVWGRCICMCLC